MIRNVAITGGQVEPSFEMLNKGAVHVQECALQIAGTSEAIQSDKAAAKAR